MSLTVTFTNNSGSDGSSVSVGFVPGSGTPFNITYASGAIQELNVNSSKTYPFPGNWYTLDQLADGVTITSFSGRVYVAIGQGWAVQSANYEPGQNVTDPNFYLRYDKMEITFTGQPADVANLTSIDYWSIPLTLTTYDSTGTQVQTVLGLVDSTTTQDIFNALNALTTPPVSGVQGALPALVPGQFPTKYPPAKGVPVPGTFARLIGPSSYPPFYPPPSGVPVTPYDTLEKYLQNLLKDFGPGTERGKVVPGLGNGVIATIKGNFAGVGPNPPSTGPQAPQTYNMAAVIDNNCNITLGGTLSKVPGPTAMLFKNGDLLNPSGIYGANAPYYLNGASSPTTPGNDVYGWVSGDLFAGLNIGAVGSSTIVESIPGVPVPTMAGALASQLWFGIPLSLLFSNLQPDAADYYNQWAAALTPLSQAYNFAYTDRFAPVFASLNPQNVAKLTITIEAAGVQLGETPSHKPGEVLSER